MACILLFLAPFQNGLVFGESDAELIRHFLINLGALGHEVFHMQPIVDGLRFRHRRHEVASVNLNTVRPAALLGPCSCISASKVDDRNVGRIVIIVVPTVDIAGEISKLLEKRDRLAVIYPAMCDHAVVFKTRFNRHIFTPLISKGGFVNKTDMRRVA